MAQDSETESCRLRRNNASAKLKQVQNDIGGWTMLRCHEGVSGLAGRLPLVVFLRLWAWLAALLQRWRGFRRRRKRRRGLSADGVGIWRGADAILAAMQRASGGTDF